MVALDVRTVSGSSETFLEGCFRAYGPKGGLKMLLSSGTEVWMVHVIVCACAMRVQCRVRVRVRVCMVIYIYIYIYIYICIYVYIHMVICTVMVYS